MEGMEAMNKDLEQDIQEKKKALQAALNQKTLIVQKMEQIQQQQFMKKQSLIQSQPEFPDQMNVD